MIIKQSAFKIAPSLAAGDLMNIEATVRQLEQAGIEIIHLDVMDGHCVPLLTIGVPVLEQLRKITKLHLDVHIMVSNPDEVFQSYLSAGADTLTFPFETAKHPHRLCQQIRQAGARSGIAINPGTHEQAIQYLLPVLDQITIMAVNPGYSRQEHIEGTVEKLKRVVQLCRLVNHKIEIQIDGGVNSANICSLINAGANSVVAGGAVFNQNGIQASVQQLIKAGVQ